VLENCWRFVLGINGEAVLPDCTLIPFCRWFGICADGQAIVPMERQAKRPGEIINFLTLMNDLNNAVDNDDGSGSADRQQQDAALIKAGSNQFPRNIQCQAMTSLRTIVYPFANH
jgi:hypothetical protein